jgi:hypothetical protein
MCGASSSQKSISQEQQTNYNTLMDQAGQVFNSSSKVFNDLQSSFSPIVAAGPGQSGFTPAELANLRSSAITNTGVATRNAQQAAGERAAAQGGGTTVLPSGAILGQNANIAEAGAAQTASQLSGIDLANAQLGQQNWMNAAGVLAGAPNVFNAATAMGNAAVGGGGSAMQGATAVNDANQQGIQDLVQVASSGAGVAESILCPAEGSLYLMADGSEKPVETLVAGELLASDDGSRQTIEEIHTTFAPVIRVRTENGFVTRNSFTHCFVTPNGFVIAANSLGEYVNTARGYSKITSVEPNGTAKVFSIVTNGNHTYRADGVWAYGVGDVASDEACERYLQELAVA